MSLAAFALVATPLLAFGGALLGHWINRRSAVELDRWRKREETMRMLRWAAELATGQEIARADVGVVAIGALLESPLLDRADDAMVATVASAVMALNRRST